MATVEERLTLLEQKVASLQGAKTFAQMGYNAPDEADPLLPFMNGSRDQIARSIAKHRFDIPVGGRALNPAADDYGPAFRLVGKFAEVDYALRKAWLAAILRDYRLDPNRVEWYTDEFDH